MNISNPHSNHDSPGISEIQRVQFCLQHAKTTRRYVMTASTGPLAGIRVIELAGIGPGPHAALLLADLGADVVRVQRPGRSPTRSGSGTAARADRRRGKSQGPGRHRENAAADRKGGRADRGLPAGRDRADGAGPGRCAGPQSTAGVRPDDRVGAARARANQAGHDINYISITGVLHAIGRKGERPVPPLNMVGDFGGGSMFLVFGILAALLERHNSGKGQVIDAAMVDGALALSNMIWAFRGAGAWTDERGVNMLDTGMAWYDTYETADGKYMAVGAIESQFLRRAVARLGDRPGRATAPGGPAGQETLRKLFTERFASKTRDEWAAIFDGTDACVSAVKTFAEAESDEHITARAR